jgi:hypothetical protein
MCLRCYVAIGQLASAMAIGHWLLGIWPWPWLLVIGYRLLAMCIDYWLLAIGHCP